jgi:excisionase family DNA binding protein
MKNTPDKDFPIPMVSSSPENIWLKGIKTVALNTGFSRRTVQSWISNGELPVSRLSKRLLLINLAELKAMLQRRDQEFRARNPYGNR